MSFTETTHTSWFSRLKNGLAGLIIGPILVIGMIWLLSWNEGRSVQTYRALVEGAGVVVSVDNSAINPANEGKLVHISGPVKPVGTPQDAAFGVSAEGAAGLKRDVAMFQWVEDSKSETKKNLGGSEDTVTTYSYKKEWRSDAVDSSQFHNSDGHQNPDMTVSSDHFTVETATIGAFTLDGGAVANLGKETAIKPTPQVIAEVTSAFGTDRPVQSDGMTIFISQSRQNPDIGDLKIGFVREDVSEASFIGAQRGDSVKDYTTSNGNTIFLSATGRETPDTMFAAAQSENTMITWLIRVGGLIGMFVGFVMFLSILGIIGDVIPFVGSIIGFGTSLIAFILTLLLGPIVIAIAWIAYRPVLAIAIIAVGVALAAGLFYLRRNKAQVPAATAHA